ncbi:amino acid adenylation domain-containing protein [Streptomyces sp. NPDC018057]|uniref:amino acid adenylation domain-containing protein n=1 Tax=unclassified Streptomyces TaxID=2593676 RepID=UPI0037B8A05C
MPAPEAASTPKAGPAPAPEAGRAPASAPAAPGLPLTAAQSGMWYAQALDPDSPALNTAEHLEIHGDLRPDLFAQALYRTAREAEVLRVRVADTPDGPRQFRCPLPPPGDGFPLHTADLRDAPDPVAAARAWADDDLARPFDLTTGPLFRHALLRLGEHRWLWHQRVHHLALDGFGYSLVARRTAEIYTALAAGLPPAESPFGSLGDLVADDLAYRAGEQYERDRAHWNQLLADRPEAPTLAGRSALPSHTFLRATARVPDATTASLRELAGELKATWAELIVVAQALYVSRATGRDDVVLGLPLMGRMGTAALRVPGMVMNVLPLRLTVRPADTLAELTRQVVLGIRAARRHQRYRFEDIRRDLGLLGESRPLVGPLVNVMPFDYDLTFAGATAVPHNLSAGPVDDLTVNVYDRADSRGLRIDHDANPALYTRAELTAHQDRFLALLTRLTGHRPTTPLAALGIATDAEHHQVVTEFNATARDLPPTTLIGPIEAQARRTPDAPALVHGERTLSYAELTTRANRLAHHLISRGAGPGTLVGVALPRSAELITTLLAVLKAGAAYLPLDPGYPADRLRHLLDDGDPVCVVTDTATAERLPATGHHRVLLDRTGLGHLPAVDPPRALTPQHPAYVIHTSGSTGRPKGVVVPHSAIDNRLRWMQHTYPLAPGDRVLQKTPSGFDVSVWEFFWAFREGATLVLADPDGHKDPAYLARVIREQGVTVCHFVPSMLQVFLAEPDAARCTGLRHVFASGEALPRETAHHFHRVLPTAALHNLYGPTEAAVDVSHHTCVPGATGPVPIGRPVWNTRLYVLDAALKPCPPGVAGELYLAGAQLADGYLGRPALTATRFVADPYGPAGARMYRTGDLARWTPDGEAVYLGRTDHQVKLRGQRLEPGEIEAHLTAADGITAATVLLREDRPGDQRLVAYVTGDAPDPDALRARLAAALPDYMVPSAFVVLDDFPLSPNGKLDRTALPAPAAAAGTGGRPPRNPTEELLTRLFAEVLGVDRVGVDDAFFDLGGTSLLAARLMSRIRDLLGTTAPLGTLFRAPTPAALADRLTDGDGEDTALDVLLPLRATGRRTPLFVFHPAGGISWCYSGLLSRLGPDQPVHGLQARGLRPGEELPATMDEMAADYAEQLRTVQPHGPYRLLGWSVGGVVAHTVAVHLQQAGERVELLALLDAYPSDQWRDLAGPTEADALNALLRMAGYEGGTGLTRQEVLTVLRREGSALAALPERVLDAVVGIVTNNARLMRTQRHRAFDGDLLFFTAAAPRAEHWLTPRAWAPYLTGTLDEHRLDCLHPEMTRPGPLDEIAATLAARLKELDG